MSIFDLKIGEMNLKSMITGLFWTGLFAIVLMLCVDVFNEVVDGTSLYGAESFRRAIKFFFITFVIGFIQLILWRISCEVLYIVLKGFEGLHRKEE